MAGATRILIADDESVFADTTAELLALRGYECECVSDGDKALEKLRHEPYDLLISDINMPGNVDLELIDQVQELIAGMPIILVTAHPSVRTAIDAFRLPVADYLLKPIDFDKLLVTVDKCLTQSGLRRKAAEAKSHLSHWCRDLHHLESLLTGHDQKYTDSVSAYVNVNMKNVADALVKFGQLTEDLSKDGTQGDQWELIASAQLDIAYNAMVETVGALRETRHFVKSKRLAKLRHKLQVLVDEWPRRPAESVS